MKINQEKPANMMKTTLKNLKDNDLKEGQPTIFSVQGGTGLIYYELKGGG